MTPSAISRRRLVQQGGAALAGLSVLRVAGPTYAFQTPVAGEVIPWLDQPEPNPVPEVIVRQLEWEQLDSWITPNDQFFVIKHFNEPTLDERDWRLEIGGLVAQPLTLTLDDLKARERQGVTFTLECSGNTGLPFFIGGVGNATWAGTPLAPLLEEAGVEESGSEVVFWGADAGEQTWGEMTITEQFARSMALADALNPDTLLVYEMNGEPLPNLNGFPVRLIAPGWYGIANVKWLTRIEVLDRRYQGNFMAREYVTMREEERDGETVWTFTSVGRNRLKSAPAKVTSQGEQYSIMGAAWGARCRGRGPHRRRALAERDPDRGCGQRLRLDLLELRLGHTQPGRAHRHLAGDRQARHRPAGAGRPALGWQADVLGEQRPDHAACEHRLIEVAGAVHTPRPFCPAPLLKRALNGIELTRIA